MEVHEFNSFNTCSKTGKVYNATHGHWSETKRNLQKELKTEKLMNAKVGKSMKEVVYVEFQ